MRPIGIFILAVLVWMIVHIEIDSYNPCSNFSKRPENTTDEVKNKLIALADSIKELAVRDA